MGKKLKKHFKRGKLGYRITILTVAYIIVLLSFLTPFITIEDANMTLATIIAVAISVVYIFMLLIFIWDTIKVKVNNNEKNR